MCWTAGSFLACIFKQVLVSPFGKVAFCKREPQVIPTGSANEVKNKDKDKEKPRATAGAGRAQAALQGQAWSAHPGAGRAQQSVNF